MSQLGGITRLAWKLLPLSLVVTRTYAGPTLTTMTSGVLGWWDTGVASDLLDGTGAATGAGVVATVRNRSAGPALALEPYDAGGIVNNGVTTGFRQVLRLVGTEAGIRNRLNDNACENSPAPAFTSDVKLRNVTLGSAVAGTWYHVWSKVNREQTGQYGASTTTPILKHGAVVVMQAGNAGDGTDRLTLFPGTASQTDLGIVPPRYTQSLTMVMTAAGLVDVWLKDTKVATGVVNPLPATVTATLAMAQSCDLHECWQADHALSTAELATLLTSATSCSKRWARGERTLPLLAIIGQSNAGKMENAGGLNMMADSCRWAMGALGVDITRGDDRNPGRGLMVWGGTPLIQSPGATTMASFINRFGGTADPSTWPYTSQGTAFISFFSGLNAPDRARLAGLIWAFSETDADHGYGDHANYVYSRHRIIADARTACGKPTMPVYSFNAWPFGGTTVLGSGSDDGGQSMRETFDAAIADTAQYETRILHNLSDADYATGNDYAHMSDPSYLKFGVRAGLVLAGLLTLDGSAVSVGGLPVIGPRITAATLQTPTTILVTIQHDRGTDIRVGTPSDVGWTVFEGWTSATVVGTNRVVQSCARVDATHLLLTLATAVVGAASTVRVWPAYGQRRTLGGGSAMDNYSQTATGLAITAQLGSSYTQDYPIAIPTMGVVCA